MSDQHGATSVLDAIVHTMDDNTSRKVYGEPVTVGEVTVIPAAKISGRGGGGGGAGPAPTATGEEAGVTGRRQPTGEGAGGGLTQSAVPVGAYVVKGNRVAWRPAIDINRVILGGQVVAIVALLTVRTIFKWRERAAYGRKR